MFGEGATRNASQTVAWIFIGRIAGKEGGVWNVALERGAEKGSGDAVAKPREARYPAITSLFLLVWMKRRANDQ